MKHVRDGESPVSFSVSVVRLPQKGLPAVIEADAEQRGSLAEAHGLMSVERFRADLLVSKWKGDGVEVKGKRVKRLKLEDGTRFTLGSTEISFERELQ